MSTSSQWPRPGPTPFSTPQSVHHCKLSRQYLCCSTNLFSSNVFLFPGNFKPVGAFLYYFQRLFVQWKTNERLSPLCKLSFSGAWFCVVFFITSGAGVLRGSEPKSEPFFKSKFDVNFFLWKWMMSQDLHLIQNWNWTLFSSKASLNMSPFQQPRRSAVLVSDGQWIESSLQDNCYTRMFAILKRGRYIASEFE